MVGELGLKARFFYPGQLCHLDPFLKKYWNSITVKKSEIRDLTHFCYFDNKTQNTRKMQNPIWNNCQNLKNFPTCFFHLKKIFFWFSGYSKFTYFFKKWVKMTNLAWIKKIELLTLIHLPYWALNGIGPMVAEFLWNCAEHVESCMVANFKWPEN